ncbi:glycoside hydrolase family 2 TIM barrel-domain containing protein [Algibacillus agarilyticus]|uniref:glycoside hydrolase family 2 TIM barrel-domain containing protein n=1 Tax=Algibacillus agarilyticus TaxID=2234133 RepID=UPI000DCF7605|nr:glycoside hydrolase family 2 TIM barrel-domain containing protein [Algibacillus agarilyticus]
MIKSKYLIVSLLCFGLLACGDHDQKTTTAKNRVEANFNHNWLFSLSDDPFYSQVQYNDKTWRSLSVPHDWSVEFEFDQEKGDGATGYLAGGVGWYRKHFATPSQGTRHYLYFDGVYNHADIWINGKKLGNQVYGYTPFYYDLTEHLSDKGGKNVIAVRVDHSRYIDSRWYTGSGIYRDVELISTHDTHIPIWGTYLTTPVVAQKQSQVNLKTEIQNKQMADVAVNVVTQIMDADNNTVAQTSNKQTIKANMQASVEQNLNVDNVKLWDLATPYLYQAKTQILINDVIVDEYTTPFGFRNIEYDADKGFFLNGRSVKIKGVNLHHDAGLVGTAVPDDVWRRRLTILKEAGVNAIRVAHNPSSQDFLDICDEMGLLVQAEIFDEWDNPKDKRLNQQERHSDYISRGYADYFQTHAEQDLKATVKRDRNHPSVIMWSIGNEIEWTYPRYAKATGYFDMNASGNYFYNLPFITPEEIYKRFHESEEGEYVLAKTAKKLSKWVKSLDTTRPVTANLILPSVSHISGYTDALDVIGYSYRRVIYDYGHRLFPDKMIMGTENVPQWHEWKAVEEREFIAGTFLWTGIDYMGEAHAQWPNKATRSGLMDVAGFKKPSYHMFKTLWNDEPHVYLTTQTLAKSPYKLDENQQIVEKKPGAWEQYVWFWHDVNHHWNYEKGEKIAVEVYANCPEVELFLNDQSLGKQQLAHFPDKIIKWVVPYSKGNITVKGTQNCTVMDQIHTSGEATQITLNADKTTINADGESVVHIEVELLDQNNHVAQLDDKQIEFVIEGPVKLLGVDNGMYNNIQRYQNNVITTAKGKALLIIQSTLKPGEIKIMAKSEGISNQTINITSR